MRPLYTAYIAMKYKFVVGEKVLCFEPDETKARVLYNAKIMDVDVLKDAKGKKRVEYKIHFQGWNHVWDRWADETFVLKDDEPNRKLQRKLARKAIKRLKLQKGRKRHHLPGVASKEDGGKIMEEDCYSSAESVESDVSATNTEKRIADEDPIPAKRLAFSTASTDVQYTSQQSLEEEPPINLRDEALSRRLVTLDIPLPLRARLEEDFTMIKKRDMLVRLPAFPNVVQILDNYVKRFGQQYVTLIDKQKFGVAQQNDPEMLIPPEKRLNLCQEVCSDVKLLFDFVLPLALLYAPERSQFKHVMRNTTFHYEENAPESISMEDTACKKSSVTDVPDSLPRPKTVPHTEGVHAPQKTAKKKNAEAQLIEETHRYLIPNQPNLDQTGLSQDAQGRRRSSRLSHHDHTALKSSDISPQSNKSETPKIDDSKPGLYSVSAKPHIFLRSAIKRTYSSSSQHEAQTASSQHVLYNAIPSMNSETYILSCGSDIKMIKELKKVWHWSILPDSYEPDKAALIPPSLVYGIHHLLRFFVKLPDILVKMDIPEFKVRVIMKHLQGLLKFLSEYERELFELDHYVMPSRSRAFGY